MILNFAIMNIKGYNNITDATIYFPLNIFSIALYCLKSYFMLFLTLNTEQALNIGLHLMYLKDTYMLKINISNKKTDV